MQSSLLSSINKKTSQHEKSPRDKSSQIYKLSFTLPKLSQW